MSRIAFFVPLVFSVLLLLDPSASVESAREALTLVSNNVIPGLFPFYVLSSLILSGPLPEKLPKRVRLPVFWALGALSGYPVGARIAGGLGLADRASGFNLAGIMFLSGTLGVGILHDQKLAWILCASHYATSALFALLRPHGMRESADRLPPRPSPASFIEQIADGAFAMIRVGATIVFLKVLSDSVTRLPPFASHPILKTVAAGLIEMTNGCSSAAALPLPLAVRVGLCASFVSFGGLAIFVQTLLVTSIPHPLRYLAEKLFLGFAAGLSACLLCRILIPSSICVSATIGLSDAVDNAILSASFIGISAAGLLLSYLISEFLRGTKSRRGHE